MDKGGGLAPHRALALARAAQGIPAGSPLLRSWTASKPLPARLDDRIGPRRGNNTGLVPARCEGASTSSRPDPLRARYRVPIRPGTKMARTAQTANKVVCRRPATGCRSEAAVVRRLRRASCGARAEPGEHHRGIRRVLVGEVDAGHACFSSPRAKTPTPDAAPADPSGHGTWPGLTVTNSNRPPSTVPERPKPRNPSSSGGIGAVVDRMGIATRSVRLPGLDHAVRHGLAGSVEQRAVDADRTRVGRVDDVGVISVASSPIARYGPTV